MKMNAIVAVELYSYVGSYIASYTLHNAITFVQIATYNY